MVEQKKETKESLKCESGKQKEQVARKPYMFSRK
jgi:hypothetical protein